MSARLALLATCVALLNGASGCANPLSAPSLARADDRLAAAEYRSAAALYEQFLRDNPNDPAAARARATRTAIERLLLAQTEAERLRREMATQQGEIDRLKAEATRLRADLERLRNIDLRQTPPTR